MVICCGIEMLKSYTFLHCGKCGKRLIEYSPNTDRQLISYLIQNYISEYDLSWKEFSKIIHELWKSGHYEGYEPDVVEEWKGL